MTLAGFVQTKGRGFRCAGRCALDRGLEVDERDEVAAPQPGSRERREEALDGVQPRGRGRREMEHPTRMARARRQTFFPRPWLSIAREDVRPGVEVLEVTTPDKHDRRRRGKNDDLDAQ